MKKNLLVIMITFLCLLSASYLQAKPQIGSKLPTVELNGDNGGAVAGGPWRSDSIRGKVFTLYYVDPDEKDLNQEMEKAVNDAGFPAEKHQSIAIINMAATWLPNFAITSSLKAKQKKYPSVIYVKDLTKTLVKKWGVEDDNYNVLVFSKKGKVLFYQSGKFDTEKASKLIDTIKSNL
jgi:uncharacterized protein